jgi:hypothetical protein
MGLRHDSTLASDWEWKILDFRVLTLINFCPDFQRENWNWFGSVCCWQRTASQRSDLQRSRTSLPSLNEKSINVKLYKLSIPAYKFPSDINLIWMGTVFQERTALNERGERNIIDSEEIDFADIKSRTNFFKVAGATASWLFRSGVFQGATSNHPDNAALHPIVAVKKLLSRPARMVWLYVATQAGN